jgi:hypothetical protein
VATHVSVCPEPPTGRKPPALLAPFDLPNRVAIGCSLSAGARGAAAFFPDFPYLFGDGGSGGTLAVGVNGLGGAGPDFVAFIGRTWDAFVVGVGLLFEWAASECGGASDSEALLSDLDPPLELAGELGAD